MSQWAEIRQLFFVDRISKKEIARRFGLDVKTVRRALEREQAPVHRVSPARGCRLDPWRGEIEAWLGGDPLSIPLPGDSCLRIQGSLFSSPRGPFSVCRYQLGMLPPIPPHRPPRPPYISRSQRS